MSALFGVLLLPAGTGAFVIATALPVAANTKYDNSTDTVDCASMPVATLHVSPALSNPGNPNTPTVYTLKGSLDGCRDGDGALNRPGDPSQPIFTGSFVATLNGTGTNMGSLYGCDADHGTMTISWNARSGISTALLFPHTIVDISEMSAFNFYPSPWPYSPFQSDNMNTGGYGSFLLGVAASDPSDFGACNGQAALEGPSSGFEGSDNGTSFSMASIVTEDSNSILSSGSVSGLDIGLGVLYAG